MKKYLVIPCLLLTIFFCQCKKSKNDENGPNLQKGLLAYFRLNENYYDSTGNCKILSNVSGTQPANDRKGSFYNAIHFDGGKFTFETKNWSIAQLSISIWVKCTNTNLDQLIVAADPLLFAIRQNEVDLGMLAKTQSTFAHMAYAKITKNNWVHFVGTFDGEKVRAYVNGKFISVTDFQDTLPSPTKVTVGSNTFGGEHWIGDIDDLRFYNRILTDEEIAILAKQ